MLLLCIIVFLSHHKLLYMRCKDENNNRQAIFFIVGDKCRVIRHLCFIVGTFLMIYNSKMPLQYDFPYQYYIMLLMVTFFISISYLNMYVLVPKFFFRAQYGFYFILLVTMIFIMTYAMSYLRNTFFDAHKVRNMVIEFNGIRSIFDAIMIVTPVIMLTTTIKLFQRWVKDNQRITELRNLTQNLELNELKNQVSPHFLFNTLNNVKALIRVDTEKATTVILKLSEFLRYQLYENKEETTMLHSEIQFISNFLNLEHIRRDSFAFNVVVLPDIVHTKTVMVSPGLFTTFIENAIKHSNDPFAKSTSIYVEFRLDENKLFFKCVNTKPKEECLQCLPQTKYGGLGLSNIKRRLELLYGDRFDLQINSEDKKYTVNLNIPL